MSDPVPPTRSRACANCGAPLAGRYCSACGQEDHSLAVPLSRLILDFLSDQFQFDSRLGRTLGLLLFCPGGLTRNYLAGQRQRYIPPIRLYLFISIAFFLVIGLTPLKVENVVHLDGAGRTPPAAASTRSAAVMPAIRKGIERRLPASAATDPRSAIERRISEAARTGAPLAGSALGPSERWLESHVESAKANRGQFWGQFRGNMPKVLFFLIPVFALLLKLFYLWRKRYYSEHLVFALHYHSVLFLNLLVVVGLVAAARVAPAAVGTAVRWLAAALGMWSVLYLVPALRTVYGKGWWGAFWRASMLWFVYFFALVSGTVGAVMVALAYT